MTGIILRFVVVVVFAAVIKPVNALLRSCFSRKGLKKTLKCIVGHPTQSSSLLNRGHRTTELAAKVNWLPSACNAAMCPWGW